MKVKSYNQFQLGFLITLTKWYKGERHLVISMPFIEIEFKFVQSKYKKYININNIEKQVR